MNLWNLSVDNYWELLNLNDIEVLLEIEEEFSRTSNF